MTNIHTNDGNRYFHNVNLTMKNIRLHRSFKKVLYNETSSTIIEWIPRRKISKVLFTCAWVSRFTTNFQKGFFLLEWESYCICCCYAGRKALIVYYHSGKMTRLHTLHGKHDSAVLLPELIGGQVTTLLRTENRFCDSTKKSCSLWLLELFAGSEIVGVLAQVTRNSWGFVFGLFVGS